MSAPDSAAPLTTLVQDNAPQSARDQAPNRTASRAVALAAILFCGFSAALPLRFGMAGLPAYFADDFFYYVLIAGHLAARGQSSFDLATPTSGYHPLWMAVLTTLAALTGGTGAPFLLGVMALILTGTVLSCLLVLRLLTRHDGLTGWAVFGVLGFAVAFAGLARTGMEVVLAVPACLLLLDRLDAAAHDAAARGGAAAYPPRVLAQWGGLAAVAFLARLDCLPLLGLMFAGVLPWTSAAAALRAMLWFGLGLSPVLLYALVNQLVFGAAIPVSGLAKGLAPGVFLNTRAFDAVFAWHGRDIVDDITIVLPAWLSLICLVAGLARLRSPAGRLRLGLFGFVALFYLMHALRSDWMLWSWYQYPVILAAPFAFAALPLPWRAHGAARGRARGRAKGRARAGWPIAGLAAGLLVMALEAAGQMLHLNPTVNGGYVTALALRGFTATHPGLYAMGDRAGIAAYLAGVPIYQLEGIVGDRALLAHIAAGDDLRQVLHAQGVAYYVVDQAEQRDGCWLTREPAPHQAGLRSPAMHGRFCAAPVWRFTDPAGVATMVFAL